MAEIGTWPDLPNDLAVKVARLAGINDKETESFADLLQMMIALAWLRDWRALDSRDWDALVDAANAAHTLHMALAKLSPLHLKWIEHFRRRTHRYNELLNELPETTYRLAHLLRSAAGKAPPRAPDQPAPAKQKSTRNRSPKDVLFQDFVRRLHLFVEDSGGQLSLDHMHKKGSLVEALTILRPFLPKGLIPDELPIGTLRKIKANTIVDAPPSDIDFWLPE
jgi:hypothetical protein